MIIEINSSAQFKTETASDISLVDFYADWCGPCKMLDPVLKELVLVDPSIKVCKVNVDKHPELVQSMNVRGIPALFGFKNGNMITHHTGGCNLTKLLEIVNGLRK